MLTNKIGAALAQFHKEIDDCEQALLEIIKVKKMNSERSVKINQANRQLQRTPIAIIGMSGLFPQAKNLQEYWEKIIAGVDCITDVPPSRWNVDDYYDPDPKAPDKTYCKRGGFIPDVDFNPMEFGLPPNQLEVTDISQLLALVVAKQALCDAGYESKTGFSHERTGVILGVALARELAMPLGTRLEYPVWEKVLKSSGLSDEDTQNIITKIKSAYINWDTNAFPGMLANVVAGRIANRFDFGATNCVVDAACASSLSALTMSISELTDYRADMMLTGGVDTDNSILAYMCFSKTPAVSPGQNVKPFDADSDGMMLGEGIGMLVLKRLEDAERDNDKIYAVIKGVGSSSDGRHKSIYAPRSEGQMKALERAYEEAGFTPQTVGLIEAHGTGTMVGDPTEFAALKGVFSKDSEAQSIALGSVKSQIGHTKAAAGAASLIKTALALHHKVLPPTINVNKPNPKLEIESSPFYLNTQTRPWLQAGETPRRAGVSSFGFGGTNFHIVLEEYRTQGEAYRIHRTPQEFLLSAPSPEELLAKCESALSKLESDNSEECYKELIESSKSAEIPAIAARLGFVADSVAVTIKKLQIAINWFKKQPNAENWELPQGLYYRKTGMELSGKVVALFSGQGSQYLEMGREIAMNFPLLQETYHQVDSLFCKAGLSPISDKVFPPPVFDTAPRQVQAQALQQTEVSQPAIGAFSVGLYKLLQRAGFKPDVVAGHSFGELTALWAAEVLSDEDYFYLVKARGQAMAKPVDSSQDAGAMIAVKGDVAKLKVVLAQFPEVKIANCNSPKQVVLAGATDEINQLMPVLTDKGFSAISLPVSGAFHTPLIGYAQKPFAKAANEVTFNSPKTPVYTNTSATVYPTEPEAIRKNLQAHMSQSVLFEQEIENIYSQGGYCFVEIGPRSILTNLVHDILGSRPHLAIALNGSRQKDSDSQLREAVVQLRVAGLPLGNLDPHQLEFELPQTQSKKALNIRLSCHNYVSDKTKAAFAKALENGHVTLQNSNGQSGNDSSQNGNEYSKNGRSLQKTNGHSQNGLSSQNGNGYSRNGTSLQNGNGRSGNGNGYSKNGRSLQKTNGRSGNGRSSQNGNGYSKNGRSLQKTNGRSGNGRNSQNGNGYSKNGKELQNVNMHLVAADTRVLSRSGQQNGQQQALIAKLPQENTITPMNENSHQQNGQSLAATVVNQTPASKKKHESALPLPSQELVTSLESSLELLSQQQSQTLKVHGQYLDNQREYVQSFFQLMQQQNVLFSNIAQSEETQPVEQIIESVERSMMRVHDHQANTLHLHQQYLQAQVASTQNICQLTQQSYSHLLEDAQVQPYKVHPEVVLDSEITEVESKREQLTIKQFMPVNPPNVETKQDESKIDVQQAAVVDNTESLEEEKSFAIDIETLSQALLAVVADKTGYPVEMLELEMDIEADLGIDSIKRVEIIGALQEELPALPQPNLEEMAEVELRTLRQIIDYMQGLKGGQINKDEATSLTLEEAPLSVDKELEIPTQSKGSANKTDIEDAKQLPIIDSETLDATQQPVIDSETLDATQQPVIDSETLDATEQPVIDSETLGQTLLMVVADKTGYPVEMLELEMDIEADLGIDSIKRVEIIGALQEQIPDLPQPNLEEMAEVELRTLGQIVDYMQSLTTEAGKKKVVLSS